MITREDLEQAICECQAEREPNSNTCIRLAAFLTIRNYLYSDDLPRTEPPEQYYSYSAPPAVSRETPDTVNIDSESDFAQAISGMNSNDAWALMDELMKTLQLLNPRLYDSVMRRITE